MDELTAHERRLLNALQADDMPSADEQARVKQRVLAELGIGAGVGVTLSASSKASAGTGASVAPGPALSGAQASGAMSSAAGAGTGAASSLGKGAAVSKAGALLAKLGIAKAVVAPVGVLLVGGGIAVVSLQSPKQVPDPGQPVASTSAPVGAAPASSVLPGKSSERDPHAPESVVAMPSAKPSKPSPKPTPKVVVQVDTLQAEAELLGAAHREIQSGQPRAAIAHLLQHQRRFPSGRLRLERQATLAVARCQAGERGRGRKEALRYRREHPTSPMVQRLEDACGLKE